MIKQCRQLILDHPEICLRVSQLHHLVLPLDDIRGRDFIHPLLSKKRSNVSVNHISLVFLGTFLQDVVLVAEVYLHEVGKQHVHVRTVLQFEPAFPLKCFFF